MNAAKNALSGDESDSENENAVTDSEDEDQAYQNLVDKDENLINQVSFLLDITFRFKIDIFNFNLS